MEIRIDKIEVYDDISKGRMLITQDDKQKQLQCYWRTDIGCVSKGSKEMPSGQAAVKFKVIAPYACALEFTFHRLLHFKVLPMSEVNYDKMGCNVIIMERDGQPITPHSYVNLCRTMQYAGVKTPHISDHRIRHSGNSPHTTHNEYKWYE